MARGRRPIPSLATPCPDRSLAALGQIAPRAAIIALLAACAGQGARGA